MKRRTFDIIASTVGLVLAALLFIAGGLLTWAHSFIHDEVHSQLAAQQIYFPPKAAFAHPVVGGEITPNMIPSVSQYAGEQLVTGQQAEAYADHFIKIHLSEMPYGGVYSKISAASLAQPNNAKLAAEVSTVFKGEALRSMLLNAYGWWKVSQITYIASLIAFGLGGLALIGSVLGFGFARQARPQATVVPQAPRTGQAPAKAA